MEHKYNNIHAMLLDYELRSRPWLGLLGCIGLSSLCAWYLVRMVNRKYDLWIKSLEGKAKLERMKYWLGKNS